MSKKATEPNPYYDDSRKSCYNSKIFDWKRTSQSSFQLRSKIAIC